MILIKVRLERSLISRLKRFSTMCYVSSVGESEVVGRVRVMVSREARGREMRVVREREVMAVCVVAFIPARGPVVISTDVPMGSVERESLEVVTFWGRDTWG